ncbi:cupin [Alicyclobacillus contaminans]|uniref:cupin domain-containing protein n=1 Tax=Alicyclobacillus contaminans TaxID=392016 RepID=UPI0003FDCABF|nr:cupin domain-containing protein [Alicyclobacillus contaminans]GMA51392.1 cupin [Alicyclobacillus contaminans]
MDKHAYRAIDWIEGLQLLPHPEGGYYRQTYVSPEEITDAELTVSYQGSRHLSTSIYFLLTKDSVSHFHRLKSDELWYFHAGAPLTVYVIHPDGRLEALKLGLDLARGQRPQVLVPKGCIFGSALDDDTSDYALVGCMVSPGFDFQDFELFGRDELLSRFPQHEDVIVKLTPPPFSTP